MGLGVRNRVPWLDVGLRVGTIFAKVQGLLVNSNSDVVGVLLECGSVEMCQPLVPEKFGISRAWGYYVEGDSGVCFFRRHRLEEVESITSEKLQLVAILHLQGSRILPKVEYDALIFKLRDRQDSSNSLAPLGEIRAEKDVFQLDGDLVAFKIFANSLDSASSKNFDSDAIHPCGLDLLHQREVISTRGDV